MCAPNSRPGSAAGPAKLRAQCPETDRPGRCGCWCSCLPIESEPVRLPRAVRESAFQLQLLKYSARKSAGPPLSLVQTGEVFLHKKQKKVRHVLCKKRGRLRTIHENICCRRGL